MCQICGFRAEWNVNTFAACIGTATLSGIVIYKSTARLNKIDALTRLDVWLVSNAPLKCHLTWKTRV
jgi:hypothetical protein